MFVVAVAHWRLRPRHAVALAGTSRAGGHLDLDLLRLHSQPRARALLLLDAGSDTIHLMTRPRSQVLIYLGLLEAANAHAEGTGRGRAEAIIEGLPVLLFVNFFVVLITPRFPDERVGARLSPVLAAA